MNTMSVKVSKRFQVAVPAAVREALKIQSGDRLLVDVQEGMLLLIPEPENYTSHLAGIQRALWAKLDSPSYLEQERHSWEDSARS